MDSRFIKKDKIDQKLRSALFRNYYSNIKNFEYFKYPFNTNTTYYGKIYNLKKIATAHVIIENGRDNPLIHIDYLLPEEIDKFCTEHRYLRSREWDFVYCFKRYTTS